MGTTSKISGRAMAALLSMALGLLAAPAQAVTIGFPLPSGTPTTLDLQSPQLVNLDQSDGYQIDFSGVLSSPGVISVTGSVTFLAPLVSPGDFMAGILVFTSLRNLPASQISCATLDDSSRVPMEIVLESFQGLDEAPVFASDATGSETICDEEGEVFPALHFDTTQGTEESFSFDLVFDPDAIDLGSLDLQILNEGYAVVPEPGTLALFLAGLCAFGIPRGARGRR